MAPRLVEQLIDAGLITEAQARASDSGDPWVPSARIVENLVAAGLGERVLAGFFVSRGFGPMLQAQELARADEALVRQLAGTDAHELGAMPLRQSHAGAIVAMADPTDERAVDKLREALGGRILPTVAKLSDLLLSIERAYPRDRPTLVTDPLALARKRTSSDVVSLTRVEAAVDNDHTASAVDPSFADLASTASPVWDRAWNRSTTEGQLSLPATSSRIPLPTVSHPPGPSPSVRSALPRPTTVSDSAVDARLAELERVTSRDEVVRIACQACLVAARGAAFLALRKGVFRGWDGAGEDVTSAGIRSLWVPASNPSILNEVLHTGRAFRGAYGQTAADHLVRAALGRQSRDVLVVPVMIGSRLIGVLCAKDPAPDSSAVERVAEAMGSAFEHLIVSRKSDG
jgi:Type II secretion system (T2SS), protein E, N-terminal domain/GAF domain